MCSLICSACSSLSRPVLDGLVDLGELRLGERAAQLAGLDVEALGGVVQDRVLGLLAPVVLGGRDRGAAAGRREGRYGNDGETSSWLHDYLRLWNRLLDPVKEANRRRR